MHNRGVRIESIWKLESPADRAISALLLPISWLYALGWNLYKLIYRMGLKSQKRIEGLKIVCVGNLEVGGVGKTPVAFAIAQLLMRRNHRVCLGMSAYGSPCSEGSSLAPDIALDPARYGDEPAMVRRKLPTLPLVLGRDRVGAARIARQNGFEIMVMDDGFQHLPLFRDCDLLVENPERRNSRCLPAGPLREPASGASRAKASLSLSCSKPEACFEFRRDYSGFQSPDGSQSFPLDYLRGEEVDVLCAIGQPENFIAAVKGLSAAVCQVFVLKDHDPLATLPPAFTQSSRKKVVTEKDAVKLVANGANLSDVFVLIMSVQFCQQERFESWLAKELSL